MNIAPELNGFQPTMLGTQVLFEGDDRPGMITNETETDIYIESDFFTGWMSKPEFFDLLGIDE
ncbi:MAG TPA: hypothetical protein VHD61_14685 [Lacunisphaera sp.]|nr:hypothetical protein [Lacunisphaera sp.]